MYKNLLMHNLLSDFKFDSESNVLSFTYLQEVAGEQKKVDCSLRKTVDKGVVYYGLIVDGITVSENKPATEEDNEIWSLLQEKYQKETLN